MSFIKEKGDPHCPNTHLTATSYWKGSHEVYSCHSKRDKRNPVGENPAFGNFFERSEEDLREILPLFHDGLLNGKFGGILLDKGIALPEDRNYGYTLPPQYRAASSQTRKVFRVLVRTQRDAASIKVLKQLAEAPSHISVEKWEEAVLRFAKKQGVVVEGEQQA